MTDASLRDLERRFRASGSVEDEAAWLRARVQAGELEESRLKLAAYCGHEGAKLAMGAEGSGSPTDALAFTFGLADYGEEACLRAAWIAQATHLEHLRREAETDSSPARRFKIERHSELLTAQLGRVAAALVSTGTPFGDQPSPVGRAMHVVRDAVRRVIPIPADLLTASMRDSLVPWALGYSDPIRERAEAHQREAAGE